VVVDAVRRGQFAIRHRERANVVGRRLAAVLKLPVHPSPDPGDAFRRLRALQPALLEFYPGLGALLVLGVVLGVPQAFMKAAMRSHLNRGSSSRTEER
jgi:hypothetical protein